MVQLVQLRSRIKAIETIKKITHAMRLISMSTHSRLKHKEEPLRTYKLTILALFNKLKKRAPDWHDPIFSPSLSEPNNLIILMGSSKGLCGSFNTALFNHFNLYLKENSIDLSTTTIVTVGKRAHSYIIEHKLGKKIIPLEELTSATLNPISHKLTEIIVKNPQPYSSVMVFSNFLKSFFIQKPETTVLVPLNQVNEKSLKIQQEEEGADNHSLEEYRWEQQPEDILEILVKQCLDAYLQHLLFQSLLAEHASRFLSMDNSTRNAQNLLEKTKLDYNKLRQTKITKELSELLGSY